MLIHSNPKITRDNTDMKLNMKFVIFPLFLSLTKRLCQSNPLEELLFYKKQTVKTLGLK